MKLSKKAEYGLRALINMGIAEELGRDRVSISELAACDNLPLKFVEQILMQLREAEYVDSKRGKFGGYFIKKPAGEIRMGDLIRLLDGPLAPISCASQSAYQKCSCADEAHCGLRMLMIDVRNAMANILDRYTLADVVEVTLRKIRRDNAGHFFLKSDQAQVASSQPEDPADPADGFLAGLVSSKK
ncbi:MAG: Rrf2 family transcriptional regulator [Opitutales bacterium]|nr:Rrf2 family transcriptional regulator [Opitutales bacterium]